MNQKKIFNISKGEIRLLGDCLIIKLDKKTKKEIIKLLKIIMTRKAYPIFNLK